MKTSASLRCYLVAGTAGLEPAASCVTSKRSSQLELCPLYRTVVKPPAKRVAANKRYGGEPEPYHCVFTDGNLYAIGREDDHLTSQGYGIAYGNVAQAFKEAVQTCLHAINPSAVRS